MSSEPLRSNASGGNSSIPAVLGRALVLSAGLGFVSFALSGAGSGSAGAPAPAAAVTRTLPAVADTTLRQQQANQNRGTDELLRLGWAQGSRALVRFDSNAIRTAVGTGRLLSAHLELSIDATGESWGNAPQNVGAHRVTVAWTEKGATWNCAVDSKPSDNRADCNPQWSGGAFDPAPTATVPHTKQSRGLVRFDVTADVAGFLTGTANYGWLLKKANEALSGRIDYVSRDGEDDEEDDDAPAGAMLDRDDRDDDETNGPRLVLSIDPGGAPDTTPPTTSFAAPADGSLLANARPTVAVTWSDAGSGLDLATAKLTVDGATRTAEATATAAGLTFTPAAPLADDFHSVTVEIRDRAGNASSATLGFTTDETAPVVAFLEPDGNPVTGSLSPTISTSFLDATSGADPATVQITLDGAPLAGCLIDPVSASCSPPRLAFGAHVATLSVRDRAGNAATTSLPFELADLSAPTVAIDTPNAGVYLATPTVDLEVTVEDDVEVATVAINGVAAAAIDEGPFGRYHAEVPLTEGSNHLIAVATDAAGKTTSVEREVFLDSVAPKVTIDAPAPGQPVNTGIVRVAGLAIDSNAILAVEANGLSAVRSADRYEVILPVGSGPQTISVRALDAAGNVGTASVQIDTVALPTISITSPADLATVAATTVDVVGSVSDPAAVVSVNGIRADASGGTFIARDVPLIEGGNLISAVATRGAGAGASAASATINVVRDLSPPYLAIAAPAQNARVHTATVTVSGLVNDLVAGTVNAGEVSVKVGPVTAEVSNRSFLARDVPLVEGTQDLAVEAVDASGNRATATLTVRRAPPGTARIEIASGDLQSGPIGSLLPQPLTVALVDAAGVPAPGRIVLFEIDGNDGSLAGGKRLIAVSTDAAGRAATPFTLGKRVGAQRVTAASVAFADPVVFNLVATHGPASLIVADDGTLQVGVAGLELPRPLIATVTDAGYNRHPGIPVRFRVVSGQGTFAPGDPAAEKVVTTDDDGRAIVSFFLSPEEGIANNRIEARIDGLATSPVATFVASGRAAGDPAATSISGVVLDNSNRPVPGATLRILDSPITATSDAEGQFRVEGTPIGAVKLIVDGSTVTRPGSWPDLEFVLSPVPGRDNPLTMPVYLLPLDLSRALPVDETHGGTVTLAEAPGFALEIVAGSVTFPGGSRSGTVSATLVHADKVPMVPNFGQQPRFIVTIQPAGARFDPPARLTLPNVDGLAPGAVTEMYSFDHDLGHFVSIGPATVSNDGRTVRSNLGVGVIKAGWHCGGNPDTSCDCESDDPCLTGAGMCEEEDWSVVIDAPNEAANLDMTVAPAMPAITARARIQGNARGLATFQWTAEMKLTGCLKQRPDPILHAPPIPGGNGATYQPNISPIMSGDLTLTVVATVDGETRSAQRNVVIRGANPTCAAVQQVLGENTLSRLACQESGMSQFDVVAGGLNKCPLFNRMGDGGVGIGQITSNPTFEDYFNWRVNVSHIRQHLIATKGPAVDGYRSQLMGGSNLQIPAMDKALRALFDSYNACRTKQGKAKLTRLILPAFVQGGLGDSPGQYERDLLRAYNGLCGPRYLHYPRHQFQLQEDSICGLILTVDEDNLAGTASWVEVDPAVRCNAPSPPRCPRNGRNYVERVLSFTLPNCSRPAIQPTCPDESVSPAEVKCP